MASSFRVQLPREARTARTKGTFTAGSDIEDVMAIGTGHHVRPLRNGYEAFVHAVADAGGFAAEEAEKYIVAVIATLEARLSFAEVSDLEAELPVVLRDILHGEPILDLPDMDEKELCARVRARLKTTAEEAETIARVVFRELRSRISAAEAASVEAQLSPGLRAMWRTGPLERG